MKDIDEAIKALRNQGSIIQGKIKELMKAKEIMDKVSSAPPEATPNIGGVTTVVGKAEQVLKDVTHDLHVDKIIERIQKQYGTKVKKNSLAASLVRYASDKRVFKKTVGQRNTFGLLEWDKQESIRIAQ